MARIDPITHKQTRIGDAAVNGLFAGLLAGLAMAVVLAVAALASGLGLGGYLTNFTTGKDPSALLGLVTHLSVSAVYGTIFGLLRHSLSRISRVQIPGILFGLFYSAVLLTLARQVILPGLQSSLAAVPSLVFTLSHLVYGSVLGLSVHPHDLI